MSLFMSFKEVSSCLFVQMMQNMKDSGTFLMIKIAYK